jgi:hypothetical protein
MKIEVTNATYQFEEEVKERSFNGNQILEEALHAAAFTNNTLGLPLYPPISQLPKVFLILQSYHIEWLLTVGVGVA